MRLASWVSCAISLIVCSVQAADPPASTESIHIATAEFALSAPGRP